MDALTSLYSELAEPLTRYAMTFIRDISLVEDIVSETFLRATKHCIANNELPARAWFYKVTRNIALDIIRKNSNIDYGEVPETVDDSCDVNPEISVLNAERMDILTNSLSKLPEPYKSVLMLKEYGNLTYAEIASIIGVSLDNVKVLLFRGRQKLKNLYRRDYYNEM
ncbi:RNA polymerase sigma factor [Pseudobacteroides cellulosolvens]|uniref:RNA polymerase sigma factor n=1 Tax=Pseudobacteroides cellulosolvens TaxID=35825 RepID=UPI0005629FF5|nr:sigma-70 family RNA polymerase sigma factor [Pseudobacteroides cellulosolvens]